MFYFWLTVFLALVVFIGRLPATIRRIKAQREALRPVPPLSRSDHVPCIMNTIGAVITEFFVLGLITLAVFISTNAAFSTLGEAPSLATGIQQLGWGTVGVIVALASTIGILLLGGAIARNVLLIASGLAIVAWMVMSSADDQALPVLLFAVVAVGVPALFIALLRLLP
ncbi:MAG: hypothetical protein AAGA21_09085 [Pseudomonadota bacterium]